MQKENLEDALDAVSVRGDFESWITYLIIGGEAEYMDTSTGRCLNAGSRGSSSSPIESIFSLKLEVVP